MYVGQLETKLPFLWRTGLLRCGKNPDFEIDKDGWVWPNAVKGKSCSKVFYFHRPSLFQKPTKFPYFRRIIFSTWATPSFLNVTTTPTVSSLTASLPFLKYGEQARISFCSISFLFSNSEFQENINWIWTFIIVMSSLFSWQSSERNTVPRNSTICMSFYFKLKSLPDLILGAARIPTLTSTRMDGFGPTRSRERTAQRLYTFKAVSLHQKSSFTNFRRTIFWI